MTATSFKYWLEYIGLRAVSGFLSLMPMEAASYLSGKFWRLVAPWFFRHKRALTHLREAYPDKSQAEIETIARDMWDCLGRVFAETLRLPELYKSGRIDSSELCAAIAPVVAEGKGLVMCSAHQGNWEVGALGLMQCGVEPTGIYRHVKNPMVDRYLRDLRAPFYPTGLMAKGPETAMRLMRHVKRGGCLAILADLREWGGLDVPFFGRPAPSTPFPAILARNLDCALFAAQIVRENNVRFRISLQRIDVPQTDDKDADILVTTARLQAALEANIRSHPEHWMWAHQRWGSAPD
jgi:KDO2-lipid IV(A) lauroyltransferase